MIKDASVEIIQKCANQCIHCSSCSTESNSMMLQFDIIRRVITGLQILKVERVCLSGGEPLLHPDILEIVTEITDHGMIADIYTSGVIKVSDHSESLSIARLSALKDAGLRTLIFNLQAANEEIYDLITQSKNHFSLVCESILNATKCGIRAEIHFVPMKQNISDAVNVVRFAETLGVSQVNFLKLVPHGRAQANSERIVPSSSDIASLQSQLLDLKSQGKAIRIGLPLSDSGSTPPCHAVREKIYIKFDGSVFGCEAFKYITFKDEHGRQIVPDNIYSKDIVEIYRESEYLKRSVELVESYEDCQVDCENCPVQKYMKVRRDLQ